MKIVSVNSFEGPSIFAPVPAIRLIVDIEGTAAPGTGFADRLVEFLPELDWSASQSDGASGLGGLGHIIARAAVELQRIAGADIAYQAVTAPGRSGHRLEVVYGHWDASVGVAAGWASAVAVARLAGIAFTFSETDPGGLDGLEPAAIRQHFLAFANRRSLDISTAALVREAIRRDIPWRRLNPRERFVQLGHGRFQKRFHETFTSATTGLGYWIARNKDVTNRLLYEIGLPVPRQTAITGRDRGGRAANRAAAAAQRIGYPVVVKPAATGKGQGVSVGLETADAVRSAYVEARKFGPSVLIEQFIAGDDHRILVVGGRVIAVAKRIPGHVVGDGESTIAELVTLANRDPRRGVHYEKIMNRLEFDRQAEQVLAQAGLGRDSVPAANQVVALRRTANISTGGAAVDVTDIIHPDNSRAAVRAAAALGIDVAGVDFLCTDIARSYREAGGAICEVNTSPGLRPHWLADPNRDVAGPILDMLYPTGAKCRVPIAAITGTSGKTTTTRMVARILEHAGHVVGFATTDGAYIDGEPTIIDDLAGASGARLVLQSPEIDAAVLETSRRGIIRRGLGFDWCDVGAVLNVGEDHVGTDGIRDRDDLARVKSLVVQAARGTAVLNGDDERCVAMAAGSGAEQVCYVSMEGGNALVSAHISSGNPAVTLRHDDSGPVIVLHRGDQATDILPAFQMPAAMDGKAMHNVHNAMFAVAIADGLGASPGHMRRALESFGANRRDTPGRLNIFTGLPFTVIVDYAHNAEKFEAFAKVIHQLPCEGRRIAAFTSEGNRTDRQLGEFAATAAKAAFDHYVCFRRDDRRGRGPSEIPELLQAGLIAAGTAAENITVAPVETEAVSAALDMARPGDLVALLYTDYERTWARLEAEA